jgi:hypothetical protein
LDPTSLIIGLVLGLVFARSRRLILAGVAVAACAEGIAVAVMFGASVSGLFGTVLVALINLGVGALVGSAVRRWVSKGRPRPNSDQTETSNGTGEPVKS